MTPPTSLCASDFRALPPLASFANLDPEECFHFVCGGKGKTVDTAARPYANFINHENFLAAVAQRRHLIFDGSGSKPLNICGRIISRMVAAGYRVFMVVVLCSHATCLERARARQARTGLETPLGFINTVFKSLQKAVPTYLRYHAKIAERVAVYVNEAQPVLAHDVLASTPPDGVASAMQTAAQLLALPGEPQLQELYRDSLERELSDDAANEEPHPQQIGSARGSAESTRSWRASRPSCLQSAVNERKRKSGTGAPKQRKRSLQALEASVRSVFGGLSELTEMQENARQARDCEYTVLTPLANPMRTTTSGFFQAYNAPRGRRDPAWAQTQGPPAEADRGFEARRHKLQRLIERRELSSAARAAQADHAKAISGLRRDNKEWESKMKQSFTAMQAQRQDLSEARRILQGVVQDKPKRKELKRMELHRRLSVGCMVTPKAKNLAGLPSSDVFISDSSSSSSSSDVSTVDRHSLAPRHSSIFQEHFGKKRSPRVTLARLSDGAKKRIEERREGSLGLVHASPARNHLGDEMRGHRTSWLRASDLP